MGSSKSKSPSKQFVFHGGTTPMATSTGTATSGRNKSRGQQQQQQPQQSDFKTRKPREGKAGSQDPGFSSQQQKTIIEHLLITKNSASHKNYSHVPCKFFRQGTCQAGDSCPFSHSLNVSTADQTPCKYFRRGNCRFGSKCANAHILPDGTRVNPPKQMYHHHAPRAGDAGTAASVPIPLTPTAPPRHVYPSNYHQIATPSYQNSLESPFVPLASARVTSGSRNFSAGSDLPLADHFSGTWNDMDSEHAIDDCDGEEFLPGELSELLTPSELKRRHSRSSFTGKFGGFGENGSLPSTSSTLLGSMADSYLAPAPLPSASQQRTASGVSYASTNYSPTNAQVFTLPTLNYTYQQEQRDIMNGAMWTTDPATTASTQVQKTTQRALFRLEEDLQNLKLLDDNRGGSDPADIAAAAALTGYQVDDAGHHDTQFILDDLQGEIW
ncbi:LAMI_0H07338g1_1 [Lachancea mirantina]|uniref:LAMI_0H07338g1_1 n=1 Tax=Lachancea mirantina TaxID=1230905 RepID=A0A1G4KFY1_9SACH|nr:LAMI_0H07338g1_1 [Lachancea mirantina]